MGIGLLLLAASIFLLVIAIRGSYQYIWPFSQSNINKASVVPNTNIVTQ